MANYKQIAIRYSTLVNDMAVLIDHISTRNDKLSSANKNLAEENKQLRRLLKAKFKKAEKEIELKHLDLRI